MNFIYKTLVLQYRSANCKPNPAKIETIPLSPGIPDGKVAQFDNYSYFKPLGTDNRFWGVSFELK